MVSHRIGPEGQIGNLGGGLISADSHRNLIKAEDLCNKRRPNEAVPYLVKALKDLNNLDAVIQMAFLSPGGRPEGIGYLEEGEVIGKKLLKKALGQKLFDDNGGSVGKFWEILQTRPYMRLLQALVRMYFEEGRYADAARTMEEMLRLSPKDYLHQKTWLGPMLNQCNRHSDALFFVRAWCTEDFPARGGTAYASPSKEVPSTMREGSVDYIPCSLVYTAALSSYKLYGDCELSRTYLKMAAKSNPNILVKILARIRPPSELNSNNRQMNGAEDAQDYLFLAQNLWMEDEVWDWVNSSDGKGVVLKMCSRDGCGTMEKTVAEFKRCAACHKVSYCGQPCQKQDWRNHKPDCLQHKQIKKDSRAFMAGKPMKEGSTLIVATDGGNLYSNAK